MTRLLLTTLVLAACAVAQPQTLHSTILDEDRRIIVRLPRHYALETDRRYAVLYKFDGDNELARYDSSIDVLSSAGIIPDLIVVAIPNGPGKRNRDLTPASLHQTEGIGEEMGTGPMGGGDRFLDFVEKELIPYIDSQYRTTSERILAAHSRGALMALQSLISKPDLFQGRFVFSAPLMRDKRRLITDTEHFLKTNPKHRSFLYCNWGEAENPGMNQSYEAVKALLTTTAPKGLRWATERARAANHQQAQAIALPAALRQYFHQASNSTRTLDGKTPVPAKVISGKPLK